MASAVVRYQTKAQIFRGIPSAASSSSTSSDEWEPVGTPGAWTDVSLLQASGATKLVASEPKQAVTFEFVFTGTTAWAVAHEFVHCGNPGAHKFRLKLQSNTAAEMFHAAASDLMAELTRKAARVALEPELEATLAAAGASKAGPLLAANGIHSMAQFLELNEADFSRMQIPVVHRYNLSMHIAMQRAAARRGTSAPASPEPRSSRIAMMGHQTLPHSHHSQLHPAPHHDRAEPGDLVVSAKASHSAPSVANAAVEWGARARTLPAHGHARTAAAAPASAAVSEPPPVPPVPPPPPPKRTVMLTPTAAPAPVSAPAPALTATEQAPAPATASAPPSSAEAAPIPPPVGISRVVSAPPATSTSPSNDEADGSTSGSGVAGFLRSTLKKVPAKLTAQLGQLGLVDGAAAPEPAIADTTDQKDAKDVTAASVGTAFDFSHVISVTYNDVEARYEGLPDHWKTHNHQFGLALTSCPKIDVPGFGRYIPAMLVMLVRKFREIDGLKASDVFRQAADREELNKCRQDLDSGTFSGATVHTLANLIKIWFRELPVHMFSQISTQMLSRVSQGGPADCQAFMDDLDMDRRVLLFWLLDLMADVVALQPINHMTAENLGIVWGPNLIAPEDIHGEDPMQAVIITRKVCQGFARLINWRLATRADMPPPVPETGAGSA